MGKDLYENSLAARQVYQEIDETLCRKLSSVMFDGPADELTRTENAQPAITAVSLAAWKAMGEAAGQPQVPGYVAGHSVGEYSALAVAGVLSIADTTRLVVERGRLMQLACDERPGGMAALIGIDETTAEEVCRETGAYISNVNSGGQIIISGNHLDLARAIDLAAARGARKAIPLAVGGAFHSGLMEPAQHGLNEMMGTLQFRDPVAPVIGNVDALPLATAAAIREELRMQLTSCVQWKRSVDTLLRNGVDRLLEIGPGRVLAGLVKRIDTAANVISIGDYETVRAYAAA